ncbi:MAG: T9SS type A sorting domain-containing protein, partial [Bacteroidetes bacterium]|nr:T9SS type A sorting domain-containing protein [Bacteroidota bacterium]
MKKIFKIISAFLFFFLLTPTYSQTIQFSGVDNNGKSKKIDSIRIQNHEKHIDTLLINTTSINLSTITSVNQFNESNNFEVSESISSENPYFVIRTSKDKDISIIISDILGKIINENKYSLNSGENKLLLDQLTKIPGLYFITFKTIDKCLTKKILIIDEYPTIHKQFQNSIQSEKGISIQSDDVFNFIGYSRYCIPDTI